MPDHKRLYQSPCQQRPLQLTTIRSQGWQCHHRRFLTPARSTAAVAPVALSATSAMTTSLLVIRRRLMSWTSSPTAWTRFGIQRRKWTNRSQDKHRRECHSSPVTLPLNLTVSQLRPIERETARIGRGASTAGKAASTDSRQLRRRDGRSR